MSKKRNRKPRGQVWTVYLTMDERVRLRSHLAVARPEGLEEIKKNTRALYAIEADDVFEAPPGSSQEQMLELNRILNEKINSGEEEGVKLTLENVTCILDTVNKNTRDPVLANKGLPITSGGYLRYLVDAIDRLEMAKTDHEEEGAVEKDKQGAEAERSE